MGVQHKEIYTALGLISLGLVIIEGFVDYRMAVALAVALSIVMGLGTVSLGRLKSSTELHLKGDRYILSVSEKSSVADVKELNGKTIRIESAKAAKYLKKRISFQNTTKRNAPVLSKDIPSGYRAIWTIYIR